MPENGPTTSMSPRPTPTGAPDDVHRDRIGELGEQVGFDRNRPDVARAYPGRGPAHGFEQPTWGSCGSNRPDRLRARFCPCGDAFLGVSGSIRVGRRRHGVKRRPPASSVEGRRGAVPCDAPNAPVGLAPSICSTRPSRSGPPPPTAAISEFAEYGLPPGELRRRPTDLDRRASCSSVERQRRRSEGLRCR